MKILQVNNVDRKGGAGKVAYDLMKALREAGYNTAMTVSKKYSDDPDVHLLRPYSVWRERILRKISYWMANDLDLFPAGRLQKMDAYKEAEIVHLHNIHSNYFSFPSLVKITAEKPVVWTLHDMWPLTAHCAHAFDGQINQSGFFTCPALDIYPPIAWHNEKYLEKRKKDIYEKSNFHIVTPSRWLAGKVGQSILKDKPISVIYNGVDVSVFKPQNKQISRQELGLPYDKPIVLVVAKRGRSNPWKGGSYAQDAISALIGDSRAYFVDLGGDTDLVTDRVKTVSFVSNPAILAKYYSAADVLLYPSIADNCPLVVLEAQACGLPVVAFNTGGIPELIDHQKTGYIAGYEDNKDLIAGIKWVLACPKNETDSVREAAIEKINSGFTIEQMTRQYIDLYNRIVSR